MDGSADRELLASVVARVERCDEGELMQLSRSLDGIERDRSRVFEEIKLPPDYFMALDHLEDADDHQVDDDVDPDDDVMNIRTVEDYDRVYRRQHGGGR